MTTIPIPVDDVTAAAFDAAPAEEKERLARVASILFKSSLSAKSDLLSSFQAAADRAGAEAQANGWTDDLDAALLRGDFDHDD